MIEVMPRIWVGSQSDYEAGDWDGPWRFVHACKEPHHRQALGYTTRGALADHEEYLVARRDNRIILNLVDTADPKFVHKEMIDAALEFMRESVRKNAQVFVHCNQGRSRSPTIAMLYMAPALPEEFEEAEAYMSVIYPDYAPAKGMQEFARENWSTYRDP
jgi:hypothetical protein